MQLSPVQELLRVKLRGSGPILELLHRKGFTNVSRSTVCAWMQKDSIPCWAVLMLCEAGATPVESILRYKQEQELEKRHASRNVPGAGREGGSPASPD